MDASSGKPKSLYRELTIAMVVLVSLVSIAVTLFNYTYFSRQAEALNESKSSEYAAYLREALEWPLWNVDDELIGKIGSVFASNAEITSLTIRDDRRHVVYHQEKHNGNQIRREIAIEHNGQHIGSVEIGLTLAVYEERDRQLLLTSIATMVLLIAVLLGTTRWLLSRMLRKPIDAFIAATDDMVEGKYRQLELPETYVEFSSILSGFKTMSDAVASRENSLRQSNESLAAEIDERKHAEEALRASEERLHLATSAGNIGVWDWDVVNNILAWEESMYDLYGIRKEDFGGAYAAWIGTLHPDDRDFTDGEIQAALRGEREYAPEFRIVRPDGTVRNIKAASKTYYDSQGKPLRMVGVNIDISERKKSEAVTQAAFQYARSLIEASMDPLVTISAAGKITDVNTATENVTGRKRTELIGSDFADYFTDPEKAREGYRQVFSQGFVTDYPLAIRHLSGKVIDVLYNASLYRDNNDNIVGVFAAARDITERKRAEQQLQRSQHGLSEAQRIAHLGNWELDLTSNELVWSDEIYRIFEIDPEKFGASYDAFLNGIHPDDREMVNKAYTDSVKDKAPYDIVHRLQMPDGRIKYVNERCETYYAEDGKPLRSVGTVHDITERKRVEEELRRYKDHLEEEVQDRTADLVLARNAAEAANKAKSTFLASMSHELRTPLNAILGFSSMMRKDALLSKEQHDNLDIINRSGEHLLTLINDVLDMAKIEAGRVQIETSPFDLGGMVRDVTDMMHVRAQEKGLQLLIDQSSEFPRYIKGDEPRLRQVLINLVGNALKFTEQGGVTVRFGMKPHATQQRLLMEVEDSGIGIKQEDLQTIFEPFVQLGQTATQKGTGLGLTITRQFVQLMGGAISVESAPGKGSTFRVELPVVKVAAADVMKTQSVTRGEIVGLAPGQPEYRILIAEDQLENQLLLVKLMKNVGFQVKVAENGAQALSLFQSWRPHLIWMDRRMPVMDGVEATRRIRALPGGGEVKIVAVTASAFVEQRDEMLKAGMDDFVRKPYRFNEIYDCLPKLLGVQYTYADAAETEEASEALLTAEMLAALPPDLRRELHDALESLESERISAVIQQTEAYDPKLCKSLARLAGNFDYPSILKVLRTN